jgi:hypothetical protein
MKRKQMEGLHRFAAAVVQWHEALQRDFPDCDCRVRAGRWERATLGGHGQPCRTVDHIAIRVALVHLRLPVDHLTDSELDQAVEQLHTLVQTWGQLTVEQVAERIQAALGSRQ